MAVPDSVFAQYGKPVLVGVGVTFIILEIIIVGLRFYARRRSRVPVGIDDWMILLALVGRQERSAFQQAAPRSLILLADIMHSSWYCEPRRYGSSATLPTLEFFGHPTRLLTMSSG